MRAAGGRRGFGWAVALAALVQLSLFAWATGPGLAGTSDSAFYLHAAGTLRTSGVLLNPDGSAYRFWPPLYPVLLAGCGASGSLAGIRLLHGACLVGSLVVWSWLGRRLLPGRRALVLPALLALSTPWLLVGKFVWAEAVFLLLFAAYAAALLQWLNSGGGAWWWATSAAGFLLPLQRTLGLFLLAGIGAGLLLGVWQRLPPRRRGLLALHLALSAAGGVLWQGYALLLAGPSRYHPGRGWGQLVSSGADFGFVLGRWLLPLPTAGRGLLPQGLWLGALPGLFWLLWPRGAGRRLGAAHSASTALPAANIFSAYLLLRPLWSAALTLVALVVALTVFAQSAAGIHDAERYASVLFAPIILLALAAWPARGPRWLGWAAGAAWLLSAALRAGHVAKDLHGLRPLAPTSGAGPALHGQRVGAAGE